MTNLNLPRMFSTSWSIKGPFWSRTLWPWCLPGSLCSYWRHLWDSSPRWGALVSGSSYLWWKVRGGHEQEDVFTSLRNVLTQNGRMFHPVPAHRVNKDDDELTVCVCNDADSLFPSTRCWHSRSRFVLLAQYLLHHHHRLGALLLVQLISFGTLQSIILAKFKKKVYLMNWLAYHQKKIFQLMWANLVLWAPFSPKFNDYVCYVFVLFIDFLLIVVKK